MKYFNDYLVDMTDALLSTRVTDNRENAFDLDKGLQSFADRIEDTKRKNGLIFFCGNGASCSMAEHMSHDFFQNAEINTYSCSETSHITAISNDLCYEDVFAYRILRILSVNDILVTISSSGNSPNIVNSINAAKSKNAFVVTFSGMMESNNSRMSGDLNFYVPLSKYGMVESSHAFLLHLCLDYYLDKYMSGRH